MSARNGPGDDERRPWQGGGSSSRLAGHAQNDTTRPVPSPPPRHDALDEAAESERRQLMQLPAEQRDLVRRLDAAASRLERCIRWQEERIQALDAQIAAEGRESGPTLASVPPVVSQ